MGVRIFVNDEPRQVAEATSVATLLVELGLNPRHVAVERNRELVPRQQHQNCLLVAEDRLEFVTLVGGG